MKFNNTKCAIVFAGMALATSSHAATILGLTADTANSDAGAFSTSFANTLTDTFAYNPDTPTSPNINQQGNAATVTGGWHGDKTTGNHVLSYTLSGGPITTDASNAVIFFDLYGRSGAGTPPNPNIVLRDNNYTVTLYNGNYSTQVAQLTGQAVPDTAPLFNRSIFNLGTGVTFDRIQVTAPAGTTDAARYFTVMEVRAASVPEPSIALLGGLGLLGLLRRRRA